MGRRTVAWESLGGRLTSAPAVTSWARDEMQVFAIHPDGQLWNRYWDGRRWHDFVYEWPTLDESFVLTEGQRYGWFTLDEALALSDLADYAAEDLTIFFERLAHADSG